MTKPQRQFTDLIRREHCIAALAAVDAKQAIFAAAALLVASGHAQSAFPEDVWAREQKFPTGLPTQPHAVAIPHADPDHVNQTSVVVATLQRPVKFTQMGSDGDIFLDVRIILLLAIKEQEKQVDMIQQVMAIIQTPALLDELLQVSEAENIAALIKAA